MNEITIDCREVTNKQEFHKLLAAKLGFPIWYGNNWDAFWDLINDPNIVNMPERLNIWGFKELAEKLPKDAEIFQKCFLDLKNEGSSIEVIYS